MRSSTPWYAVGRKPEPQQLFPPSGAFSPETSTTKPGRSRFSLPSPYVSHAPIDGRPTIWWPVFMKICAGAWLNWVVWTVRTRATSSAIARKRGSRLETSMPDCPHFSNVYGEPRRRGVPLMKANRSPFTSSSGIGWPECFCSAGFGSRRSTCDGAPAMKR